MAKETENKDKIVFFGYDGKNIIEVKDQKESLTDHQLKWLEKMGVKRA